MRMFLMFQDGCQQNRKIDCHVYSSSFKVICDFQYPWNPLEVLPLGNLGHLTTFYPFLTTFSSSGFRISNFLPFGGWQVKSPKIIQKNIVNWTSFKQRRSPFGMYPYESFPIVVRKSCLLVFWLFKRSCCHLGSLLLIRYNHFNRH